MVGTARDRARDPRASRRAFAPPYGPSPHCHGRARMTSNSLRSP